MDSAKELRKAQRLKKAIHDLAVMKAVIIPYKKYLTFSEVMIFCDASESHLRTQFKLNGIKRTSGGYYLREEVEKWMQGEAIPEIKLKI
ncbi:MAG: hypothetical protein WCF67_06475 [Chitinophagaceae bacterium]